MSRAAVVTYTAWLRRCGDRYGGENLLRVNGRLYAILPPTALGNGALRGRVAVFGPGGLQDVGAYHIAADGTVLRCPGAVRAMLIHTPIIPKRGQLKELK